MYPVLANDRQMGSSSDDWAPAAATGCSHRDDGGCGGADVQHECVASTEGILAPEGQPAWEEAVRDCAARLLAERGVSDRWSVTRESGRLWVNYDRMRVQVGAGADVTTELELFEEIDSWVAHERPAGPGRWLQRDAAAVQEAGEAASRCVPWFRAAATRLAADLENAWGVVTTWEVTDSRTDLPWPGEEQLPGWPPEDDDRHVGLHGVWETTVVAQEATEAPAPQEPGSERVSWPEIKILMTAADGSGSGHSAPYWDLTSEEDAIDELAVLFQDALIEEVWGYWPTCPAHDFSLEMTRVEGVATWVCTEAGQVLTSVGSLDRDPHAPVLD